VSFKDLIRMVVSGAFRHFQAMIKQTPRPDRHAASHRSTPERPKSLVPVWSSILQRHRVTHRLGYLHKDLTVYFVLHSLSANEVTVPCLTTISKFPPIEVQKLIS